LGGRIIKKPVVLPYHFHEVMPWFFWVDCIQYFTYSTFCYLSLGLLIIINVNEVKTACF